jgi:hypothetical protein
MLRNRLKRAVSRRSKRYNENETNLNGILSKSLILDKGWQLGNKVLKKRIKFNKKYLYTLPSNTLLVNSYNLINITLLQ